MFVKKSEFIEEKRRNCRINGLIVVNGPDEASFDRNGAIKLRPFDWRWRVEVRPHRAKKRHVNSSCPLDLHRAVMVSPRVAR